MQLLTTRACPNNNFVIKNAVTSYVFFENYPDMKRTVSAFNL